MSRRLCIGRRWQYRYDPSSVNKYTLFDVFTTREYNINHSISTILSLVETSQTIDSICDIIGLAEKDFLGTIARLNEIWPGLITETQTSRVYSAIELEKGHTQYQLLFPRSAEIQITDKCNLCCKHCIVSCDSNHKTKTIETQHWIKCLQELEYNRTLKVVITGGEILTYEGIGDILSYMGDSKMHYYILSNGILVNDRIADLLSHPNITVSVSMDGISSHTHDFLRGKGAYEKLKRGLEVLFKYSVNVELSVTVHAQNLSEIIDLIEFAVNSGCQGISFILLDVSGRATSNPELHLSNEQRKYVTDLLAHQKGLNQDRIIINHIDPSVGLSSQIVNYKPNDIVSCTGAVSHVVIAPNGDVYPCAFAFGLDEFCAGNIREESLKSLWNTNKWGMMRGGTHYKDLRECSSCPFTKQCSQQSCRIRALRESGSYYGKPLCMRSLDDYSL